jgi:thiamine biosynthesis lipoprotein
VLRLQGETMGTTYSLQVVPGAANPGQTEVAALVDGVLAEANERLSTWNPDSEISALNRHGAGSWIPLSPTLLDVLAAARDVSERTGGAFDVTVGPLVELWGFGAGPGSGDQPPPDAEISAALESAGYGKLELRAEPPALRKASPALRLDVGAIAPGYAVDRIARGLDALGARDYLVEIGGEVRARGRSPAGRPWRVAVEAPVPGERRAHAVVELDDAGVSTSGDYRDFRIEKERRISHTIDPRTGRPVEHQLTSVTVVHDSAMLADAYATALMVLGPREGFAMAERLDLAALFISRDEPSGGFSEKSTAEFQRLRRPLP